MISRTAITWVLLLAIAVAFALGTRTGEATPPDVASTRVAGGGGAAALADWLRGTGADVRLLDEPLTALPRDVTTVILAAPSAAELTRPEVEHLRGFVNAGGRLVYLRGRAPQPVLDEWLQLSGGADFPAHPDATDLGGATARVQLGRGLFAGLGAFRISAGRGLSTSDAAFLTVASVGTVPVLLWRPEGRGELVVAAGSDLVENRRVELADNRLPWLRMAADGPIAFDEYHHRLPPPPPLSLGLWVFAAQLLLCAGALALARGTLLGPPRRLLSNAHRPALEYAQSMGRRIRDAGVEGELVAALELRLRRALHERMGVPLDAAPGDLDRTLAKRDTALSSAWSAWSSARAATPARVTPEAWWALSRLAAHVEAHLPGVNART